ncbi:protein FAM216A isoform 2-T2 [Anomaloglossus baeobatrachus]
MEGPTACKTPNGEGKESPEQDTGRTVDFSHKDPEGAHEAMNGKEPQKGCKRQNGPIRQQVKTIKIPRTMKNEAFLKHPDLTMGQKRYLYSIAKIYSTSNLRALTEKHLQSQIRCEYKQRLQLLKLQRPSRTCVSKSLLFP